MEFLTGTERDLDLDEAMLHKYPQGDKGFAALFNRPEEFIDLAAVQEEFAFAAGFVVLKVPEFVFPDVAVVEPDLPFFDSAKGFPDLGIALTDRLHLRAEQDNPRLKAIAHEVIVRGFGVADFPITGIAGFFFGRHGERSWAKLSRTNSESQARALPHLKCPPVKGSSDRRAAKLPLRLRSRRADR